jgi:PLP dependent protein
MFPDVLERIQAACQRSGRKPHEVKLVAISKGHSPSEIEHAVLQHGHRILGENRIQEWQEKAAVLENAVLENIEWHFIGNLQRNKVKYCLPFSLIHSLNSERLANELQDFGAKNDQVFRVLLEVNLAAEQSKQGIEPQQVENLADIVQNLPNLRLEGLMTMAPYSDTPDTARPYFAHLRQIRDKLGLKELSMGMSGDVEVAIEEGATIVRVGTALFQ